MNRETKKMVWLASAVVLLTLGSTTKEYAKSKIEYDHNKVAIGNQKSIENSISKIYQFQHTPYPQNLQSANMIEVKSTEETVQTEKSTEIEEILEIEETKDNEIYSASELEILYRITEAEASGEGEFGKTLVANVILNRVHSEKFPNSIEEVVFQRNHGVQFSPVVNGRYCSVTVTDETKEAVHKALKEDYTNGALYFRMTKGSKGNWHDRNLQKVFSHGTHTFYK